MAFNQAGLNSPQQLVGLQQQGQVDPRFNNPALTKRLTGGLKAPIQQQVIPQQAIQPQPQFGLAGAEQSLQGGLQGGLSALSQGQNSALGTLQIGNEFAQNQLQQGQGALTSGALGAQNQLQQGINALGGNFNAQAANVNTGAGQGQFQQAAAGVNQFTPAGLQAQQRQAALSGALGNDAQAQAFTAFNESPEQAFLRQQGLDAVTNQASATGGVGGGELLRDLTQFGTGVAAQDFQNKFNRLGFLSGQSLQAAGQAGQFLSQGGQTQANLAAQNAQMQQQANLANQQNRLSQAQGIGQLFSQGAGIQSQLGQNQANLFDRSGGLASQLASQGAGFQNQAGINAANLFSGTGQNLAQGRLQTGRDLASQIGQGTSALSQLAQQQGAGTSDILGSSGVNISNLLSGAGQLTASQQQQLAQLLANASLGEGTQLANQQIGIGNAQASGRLGASQALKDTTMQLATALSDKRLKDNIENIGVKNGYNIYKWVWNELYPVVADIGKSAFGVIAQEVEKINPAAVTIHASGFKQVNYSMIGVNNG